MASRSLTLKFLSDTSGINKGIKDVNNKLNGFGKSVKAIGGFIAAAFAIDVIKDFGVEAFKLGEQMKSVRKEFDRIVTGASLEELRKATQGTVDDLSLMKQAVSAVKLGLDSAQLPAYFEFAAKTAAATGESVDYLTDSIVKGIGRESILIIDNLGINMKLARQEGESFGETVERIAKTLNQEMGDVALPATQQLSAAWTNLKIAIGEAMNSGFISGLVSGVAKALNWLTEVIRGAGEWWVKLKIGAINALADIVDAIGDFIGNALKGMVYAMEAVGLVSKGTYEGIRTLDNGINDLADRIRQKAAKVWVDYTQKIELANSTKLKFTNTTNETTKAIQREMYAIAKVNSVGLQPATHNVKELTLNFDKATDTIDNTSEGINKLTGDLDRFQSTSFHANTEFGGLASTMFQVGTAAVSAISQIAGGGGQNVLAGITGLVNSIAPLFGPVGGIVAGAWNLGTAIGSLIKNKKPRVGTVEEQGESIMNQFNNDWGNVGGGVSSGSTPAPKMSNTSAVNVNVSGFVGNDQDLGRVIKNALDTNLATTAQTSVIA